MSRQAKSPSLAQDLLMLGDIYLTLGWMMYQRLRHSPLWPWEAELGEPTAPAATLERRQEEERPKTGTPKHG